MAQRIVLIVDDDMDLLSMLKATVESWGYKAVVAADALTGFMQAQNHKPHLVLLDFHMPAATGSPSSSASSATPGSWPTCRSSS